eukprot:SAG11_NODE_700_length_7673_cov_7.359255_1_plen_458_part_10
MPENPLAGIISLLYKKGDPRLLSNYRGITLLQRGYVLFATVLAVRMRRPASLACNSSQRAFIPGELLGDNLNEAVDTLCHCDRSNQKACCRVISADLLKYYDLLCPAYTLACVHRITSSEAADPKPHLFSEMTTSTTPGVVGMAADPDPGEDPELRRGDDPSDAIPPFQYAECFSSWACSLHTGGTRAVMVNGALSRWFELLSGLPQGSPASCLESIMIEQPKADLMNLDEEGWTEVKAKFQHIAELQHIEALVPVETPGAKRYMLIQFADDLFAFFARRSVDMCIRIMALCGLGPGATLNMRKTFAMLLGPERDLMEWEAAQQAGISFVPAGGDMEVTGLRLGYAKSLQETIWKDCIARGTRNIAAWSKVKGLERPDRAMLFRTFAMSVWTLTAQALPPAAKFIRQMDALRRRFVLTGRLNRAKKQAHLRNQAASAAAAGPWATSGPPDDSRGRDSE